MLKDLQFAMHSRVEDRSNQGVVVIEVQVRGSGEHRLWTQPAC